MQNIPFIFGLDFYKTGHHKQYLPGTTEVVSNLTSRGSRIQGINNIVWFGSTNFIRELDAGYQDLHWEDIDTYENLVRTSLNDPSYSADHIRDLHSLGYLPLEIRSLPEGTVVPMRVPALTIRNTHPDFAWLPNFLETQLSAEIWHSSTAATIARAYRETFDRYAKITGSPAEFCDWQGHDFSARGMCGIQAGALSGLGHLLSFTGTDTVASVYLASGCYHNCGFIGGSVPATEHSVMTAAGREGEKEVLEHLLRTYPEGIVSVVSDSYDFWGFVEMLGTTYKDRIKARNGKLVIRPDSGDPVKILVGDPSSSDIRESMGLIELLWHYFGGTTSSTGHKILDSHVGAIYGDSITLDRQKAILNGLLAKGFASCNVVLGIGSYTYQYVTRDTFGFAMKATYMERDGKSYNIFKEPKTDNGTKFSCRGLPFVTRYKYKHAEGLLILEDQVSKDKFESPDNLLEVVYKDGQFSDTGTDIFDFSAIRLRLKNQPSIFS